MNINKPYNPFQSHRTLHGHNEGLNPRVTEEETEDYKFADGVNWKKFYDSLKKLDKKDIRIPDKYTLKGGELNMN